ncbi:uncharacterized protein B0H18DRAFT_1046511, partial [Fomitopsis serialis]|uniref:uncharacterized protein n=1 Tax=Fomitopsis serialis TaxID=139415 RepID=UPI0020075A6F
MRAKLSNRAAFPSVSPLASAVTTMSMVKPASAANPTSAVKPTSARPVSKGPQRRPRMSRSPTCRTWQPTTALRLKPPVASPRTCRLEPTNRSILGRTRSTSLREP